MNVLLLGSGGREHALAWKIAQSPKLSKLFIAPGNAGTAELGTNIEIAVQDFEKLGRFAIDKKIDMLVVGPEDPLVKGVADFFQLEPSLKNIAVIGPSSTGALLEGSKEYAKEFMSRHKIPTAKYFSVTKSNLQDGIKYLETMIPPFVLKADGLAAGKGVLIMDSIDEARKELENMIHGKFGKASEKVVIEEYLEGIELSTFVITDGKSYKILPEAKDYKRIGEGDTGLNTGGMGCISPVPFANNAFLKKVKDQIIAPTIQGLQSDQIRYTGFIFFGLMNKNGDPYVIEYNVRMGDPEAEVIIPRLKSDILEIFTAACDNKLDAIELEIDPRSCATVMLVSGGYPEAYEKGKTISNLDKVKGSIPLHAGTRLSDDKILTNGGRVISVSSLESDFRKALEVSYRNAEIITFDHKYYRRDIGFDL
jgi:phosphoribosylamine--glycine ligase